MAFSLWYYCWCHHHISYHTLCWFVCFVKTRKSAGRQPDVVMAIIVLPVSPRRSLTSPSVFGRDSRVSRSVETPLFVGHKSLFRIQSRLRHSDLQPQHTYAEFWRRKKRCIIETTFIMNPLYILSWYIIISFPVCSLVCLLVRIVCNSHGQSPSVQSYEPLNVIFKRTFSCAR